MEIANKHFATILICVLVLLLAFFSISNGSLWGDEICRVADPISGDLSATLKTAMGYAQPGYMLFMMLWAKLIGTSEFLLRCSNLPFACLALLYAFRIVRSRGWRDWWALAFFVHPMFVYYMDEATPYIIVYALSLAFIYHVYCAPRFHDVRNLAAINAIYLLGVFIHFIFGFIIVFYFAQCLLTARKDKKLVLRHAGVMACFCPAYLPLLAAYVTSLKSTQTGFGLRSLLYIPYAFLGMQGAGLSRNDLRAKNFDKLQPVHIFLLFLFVIALVCMLLLFLRHGNGFFARNRELVWGLIAYFAVILPVAAVVHMGLWERHCMPSFPVYMILLIDIFHRFLPLGKRSRALLAFYALLLCVSAGNIVFNYYYSCDDYKGVTNRLASLFEQNKDLVVIDNYETQYYSYLDAVPDPKAQILHAKSDDELIGLLDTIDTENAVIVLFEKNCSKSLYHRFDSEPNVTVDDSFNSFRIISFAQAGKE